MKKLLFPLAALAFAASAQAQVQPAPNDPEFAAVKAKIEARLQENIQRMNQALACVQQAQDRWQLKACRDRDAHRDHRGDFEGHRPPPHRYEGPVVTPYQNAP